MQIIMFVVFTQILKRWSQDPSKLVTFDKHPYKITYSTINTKFECVRYYSVTYKPKLNAKKAPPKDKIKKHNIKICTIL